MKKLYFRQSGYVIEFLKLSGAFLWYLFLRTTAFLIDISLFAGLQILLYLVFKTSLVFSMFFGFAAFLVYNLGCSFIFKNKTFGMFVARLVVINYDGCAIGRNKMIVRMFVYSLYAIPFLGWILILVSFIALLWTRGLGFVCIFSKTQVATVDFSNGVNQVYKDIG